MSFNVLSRHQNIAQNYLLEASAGTGKTFAIENIVVRLLLEKSFSLSEILVVTFTKQAVRDLKKRIRKNLETALSFFKEQEMEKGVPDYIVPFLEDETQRDIYAKKLERALFSFDEAEIYTIHGFCAAMLSANLVEGDLSLDKIDEEELNFDQQLSHIIRNFFRTGLNENVCSPAQLKILFQDHSQKLESLENSLKKILKKNISIEKTDSFQEQYEQFLHAISYLKEQFSITYESLTHDYTIQIPLYTKITDDVVEQLDRFAHILSKEHVTKEDFDILIQDGLVFLSAFDEKRLRSKKAPISQDKLKLPGFSSALEKTLFPIIQKAKNPSFILSKVAFGCQEYLHHYLESVEIFDYDSILKAMQKRLLNPHFLKSVQKNYKAAIIDEFQDTDALQWDIFETLFLNPNTYLYLVGDPKQSIYSFRQADIYTYLKAAQKFEKHCIATLDTNYRSDKQLVTALNTLLNQTFSPNLISLPRINQTIPCNAVKAGISYEGNRFHDHLGNIHFFFPNSDDAEKELFGYIAGEIYRLKANCNIHFHQFAILVSDRFQAARLSCYLDDKKIPSHFLKPKNLGASSLIPDIKNIFLALLHPKNEAFIKIALGGKILQWSAVELLTLNDPLLLEKIVDKFLHLRKIWHTYGLSHLIPALLKTAFNTDGISISEKILAQKNGLELLEETQELLFCLLEKECEILHSETQLLHILDALKDVSDDSSHLKKQQSFTHESVQILTLHSSKGLEFDIVFALNVISRTPEIDAMIPVYHDNKVSLKVSKHDELYLKQHCDELEAEKMRELYVAFTRAKYRLYIPALFYPDQNKQGRGSPLELFVKNLTCSDESNLKDKLIQFIEEHGKKSFITHSDCECEIKTDLTTPSTVALMPPHTFEMTFPFITVNSFTSLSKKGFLQDVEITPPHDLNCILKNVHTLPAGNETGLLLHAILEKFPFEKIMSCQNFKELEEWVYPFVQKTPYQEWLAVITETIYHVLHAPLPTGFCLGNISSRHSFKEMEFLYPTEGDSLIKGVIDFVFEYQERYYIVDWKSNWLGKDHSFYETPSLEKAMHENDYFLQNKLYKTALEKYLEIVDPRPFQEIFGGSFYFFLRGLPKKGIFFIN